MAERDDARAMLASALEERDGARADWDVPTADVQHLIDARVDAEQAVAKVLRANVERLEKEIKLREAWAERLLDARMRIAIKVTLPKIRVSGR